MTFVVLEGIEGSGKSTLLAELTRALRSEGYDVVATREPGGTALGDAVRETFLNRAIAIAPMTEALLVNAARAQHVADVIGPALATGKTVLCDRFIDSTLAYQGYGRGLELAPLRELCTIAAGAVRPDLTLLLDVPVEAAFARLPERTATPDRIEREDGGFHQRVRRGFLAIAAASPHHRIIDGTQLPARVFAEALDSIRGVLDARVT